VLQYCCSIVAVLLQSVAVCCSVLQRVAALRVLGSGSRFECSDCSVHGAGSLLQSILSFIGLFCKRDL